MNKTRLRDRAARACLRIAKRAGVEITFQNPGEEELTLWALIESSSRGAGMNSNVDSYDVSIVVPRQETGTGEFPPLTGILTGAHVTVTGRHYAVESADSDFEDIVDAATVRMQLHVLGTDDTVS